MKYTFSVLLITTLFLVGCTNEKLVSIDEVVMALKEENIQFQEMAINEQNVFHRELNGVEPNVFNVNQGSLSIYVFPSSKELDKGKDMFNEMTAIISLRPYKQYEINNLLIFAIDLSVESEEKLQRIIENFE